MRRSSTIIILSLLLLGSVSRGAAQSGTALRLRVRDLDDRGVAGIALLLRDASDQAQTVQTTADGTVVVERLPGEGIRLVQARSADGQMLLMDENDPAGGLRIPLRPGQLQALDLRLTDGMLFVEPAAVTEGPVPTALAQIVQPGASATQPPTPTIILPATPTALPPGPLAPSRQAWSLWWCAWALPLLPLAGWALQARSPRRPR